MIENINSKIWNIKELSQAIKNTIENSFEYVRIRGEISKPSFPSSGHIYFSLKDDSSIINATVWKWTTTNIGIKPEEGLEVICTGKLTTYSGRSSYQINVSKIEHAGEGALLKKLEERKKYFFEKGYFNDEIKKKLPLYPTCVGVITSLQGSVIEDILETFRGRWPCKIIIYSVPVQGLKAAEKISSSIDYFNNLHDLRKKPDLLIIARGGGSVEDLWAFNEEILIEKVFKSKLPIVSAIGHETDTTLIDMVSDIRAPTPTKAAVIVTPNKADILSKIKIIKSRIQNSILHIINENNKKTLFQKKFFDKIENFLLSPSQRLDIKTIELGNLVEKHISEKNLNFLNLKSLLGVPEELFNKIESKVVNYFYKSSNFVNNKINFNQLKFTKSMNNINLKNLFLLIETKFDKSKSLYLSLRKTKKNNLAILEQRFKNLERLLENSNLKKIFDRGFAYVENHDGKKVNKLEKLIQKKSVKLKFIDGIAEALILNKNNKG